MTDQTVLCRAGPRQKSVVLAKVKGQFTDVDTLADGEWKLQSSTLATFNRKVQEMMVGKGFESEEDEIPQLSFDLSALGSDEL